MGQFQNWQAGSWRGNRRGKGWKTEFTIVSIILKSLEIFNIDLLIIVNFKYMFWYFFRSSIEDDPDAVKIHKQYTEAMVSARCYTIEILGEQIKLHSLIKQIIIGNGTLFNYIIY